MKQVKTMYLISIFYLMISLLSGLFYHEIAYYTHFTGTSTLRFVHPHGIILGAFLFLIIPLFMKNYAIQENKYFSKFIISYNLGLIISLVFMIIRGITQLLLIPVSSFSDHLIGGLAGIGHIILTIGIYFLYKTLITSSEK